MKFGCHRRFASLKRTLASVVCTGMLVLHSLPVSAAGTAIQLELDGPLGTATAEYLISGIQQANDQQASLVIIRMDTPGGLMEPMRDIIQAILNSGVPVVTYVAPGGARADSAGTYILIASHIAAMAPTTHLGAATPVSLGGEDTPDLPSRNPVPGDDDKNDADDVGQEPADEDHAGDTTTDETPANDDKPVVEETAGKDKPEAKKQSANRPGSAMDRKVMNDAIAYIRGLAEARGRNADWAESAVRDASTLVAREALEQNVIDVIATDVDDLLAQINGKEVSVNDKMVAIDSESLKVEEVEPTWRIKVLRTIANPQVILLLLAVGVYGLLFEGYNPGAILPGVAGAICLLLAAYALQILPVNYAGLALIIVGFALIVAETMVPSFGALGLGGIIAFIFGSIMMFDSGIPGFGVSKTFIIGFAIVTGGLLYLLVHSLLRIQRRGAVSGVESILGGIGFAMDDFNGEGMVWLEGESWSAVSKTAISKNQRVRVRAMHGLTLEIEPDEQHSSLT